MKDANTLITIVGVLGDGRYDAVAPYVARLAVLKASTPAVKDAANQALSKLGVVGTPDGADECQGGTTCCPMPVACRNLSADFNNCGQCGTPCSLLTANSTVAVPPSGR